MSRSTPLQCPICGWTGTAEGRSEQPTDSACPVCGEDLPGVE